MLQYVLVMMLWVIMITLRIRGEASLEAFTLATMILVTNSNIWAASGSTLMGGKK